MAVQGWLYLSFAEGDEFRGGLIVRGNHVEEATLNARLLNQHPGGQVMWANIDNLPPEAWRDRLLSKMELRQMGEEMSGDPTLKDVDRKPVLDS